MQISFRVEHDKETGDYIAYCPVMKPVSVYGKSEKEVSTKLMDAIHLYVKKHPDVLEDIRTSSTLEV